MPHLKSLPLLLLLASNLSLSARLDAQVLKGQWTGSFATTGDVWGGKTEYIMELDIKGSQVEGYSYTYFMISGKRHYVICRLEGSYDKGSRSLSVTEVAKVKSNTPPDFKDLFQTHRLTYLRQGDVETLEGKWTSATPGDLSQTGETRLERRMLARVNPATPPSQQQTLASGKPVQTKPQVSEPLARNTSPKVQRTPSSEPSTRGAAPPLASSAKPVQTQPANREKPLETPTLERRNETPAKPSTNASADIASTGAAAITTSPRVELRSNKLVQVIEVEHPDLIVELYDNGSVDGDTVSLFFNNRLMVSHRRLSTTPITLELALDRGRKDNELVMFAESLGEIPPNTALMVVKARDKRYEVNITSTEQTNGSVSFRLKE